MDATKVASEPLAVRRLKYLCGNDDDDNSLLSDADLANCDNVFRETALEEKCGVFGCISNGDWPTSLDVAHIICLGLVGLQHRGQESAGIVTCKYKSEPFSVSRAEGLVSSAFSEYSMMSLKGNLGVGHTRYSTTGGSGNLQLAQPFVVHTSYGTIAVSHNGELVNSSVLRKNLLDNGVGLTTGSDSELIIQCLSQPPPKEFRHPRIRKQLEKERGEQQQYYNNQYNNNVITGQQTTNNNGTINHSEAENVTTRSRSGSELSLKSSSSKAYQKRVDSGASENERIPLWKSELTREEDEITSRLLHLMSVTPVSYSLIIMFNECIYACRDSFGNRPLTIGMLVPPPYAGDHGDMPWSIIDNCLIEGWCISSESCSFPSIHAKLKRDVEPGEIVKFERNSKIPKTLAIMPRPPEAISPAFCIFEYVYFARPDSILEKQTIYAVRMKCGRRLAIESPATTSSSDLAEFIVAPVPESSIPAALGYAQESKLPYVEVFCKNRYVGRTFIQPSIRLRRLGVAKKFGPLTENCLGKSIILIDDSIVRGTTIGQLVRLLKEAGAKEVHIRIASPPLHFPCYMGINIPTKEELIANHLTPDEFALNLGAASLKYLSIEGLKESVQSGIIDKLKLEKSRNLGPQGASAKPATLGLNGAPKPGISTSSVAVAVAKPSSPVVEKATVENNTSKTDQQQDNDLLTDKEIQSKVGHCLACLTGEYPVALEF